MKVNACAALALALAVVAPQGLVAQEGEGEDESEPMTDGRDVTLVFGAGGFFEGFDNGMLAEETYVVPEGLVLCLLVHGGPAGRVRTDRDCQHERRPSLDLYHVAADADFQ